LAGSAGAIQPWDVATGHKLAPLEGQHSNAVSAIVFSPDGRLMATVEDDGSTGLWDALGKHKLFSLIAPMHDDVTEQIISAAFSPDGKLLAAGTDYGEILLWDTSSGEQLQDLSGHAYDARVAFSADGKLLASASPDGTIRLWSVYP